MDALILAQQIANLVQRSGLRDPGRIHLALSIAADLILDAEIARPPVSQPTSSAA